MFSVGMGPIADSVFALATMLIAIPTGVKIFNWIGTMWGGSHPAARRRCTSRSASSRCSSSAASRASCTPSPPADLQQTDTYFVVAHFHYVLFGGSHLRACSRAPTTGCPKMTGRMLDEGLGKLHFWLMLIGFNLTFFPMHFVGLRGHAAPDLHLRGGPRLRVAATCIETVGAFILGVSFLVFICNVIKTTRADGAMRRPIRGMAPRSSGRSRRRRRSSTSRRSPRCTGATRSGRMKRDPRRQAAGAGPGERRGHSPAEPVVLAVPRGASACWLLFIALMNHASKFGPVYIFAGGVGALLQHLQLGLRAGRRLSRPTTRGDSWTHTRCIPQLRPASTTGSWRSGPSSARSACSSRR